MMAGLEILVRIAKNCPDVNMADVSTIQILVSVTMDMKGLYVMFQNASKLKQKLIY